MKNTILIALCAFLLLGCKKAKFDNDFYQQYLVGEWVSTAGKEQCTIIMTENGILDYYHFAGRGIRFKIRKINEFPFGKSAMLIGNSNSADIEYFEESNTFSINIRDFNRIVADDGSYEQFEIFKRK